MLMWDDPQSWHVLAQVLLPLASPSWLLLADPGNSWILGTSDPNSWMVYLMGPSTGLETTKDSDVPKKNDDPTDEKSKAPATHRDIPRPK